MMNQIVLRNVETDVREVVENVWPRKLPEEKLKMNALNSVALRVTTRRWREEKLFPENVLSGENAIVQMPEELKDRFWSDVEAERKLWEFEKFE